MSAEKLAAGAPPALPLATPAQRARIVETAQKFEAQILSLMMQPMFQGLSTDGVGGGGQAEGTYRGFLVDELGKQTAKAGGVGLAAPVAREMLRMQGLS
ncbi:MAG: rod-binding protein [Caulobacteraceae bacterium]